MEFIGFLGGLTASVGVLPSDLGLLGILVGVPLGFGIAMRPDFCTSLESPWVDRAKLPAGTSRQRHLSQVERAYLGVLNSLRRYVSWNC